MVEYLRRNTIYQGVLLQSVYGQLPPRSWSTIKISDTRSTSRTPRCGHSCGPGSADDKAKGLRGSMQYMSVFNVEETLKHNKSLREIEKIVKLLGYSPAVIDKIVQQWRAIHLSKWNETNNTVGFWSEIWKFRRFLLTFCFSHDVIPLSYSVHYNYEN